MDTNLRRWGNSMGLLVPKAVLVSSGLKEGDRLTIEAEPGGFSVRRAQPRYQLAELLARMPRDHQPDEIEFGSAGEELL